MFILFILFFCILNFFLYLYDVFGFFFICFCLTDLLFVDIFCLSWFRFSDFLWFEFLIVLVFYFCFCLLILFCLDGLKCNFLNFLIFKNYFVYYFLIDGLKNNLILIYLLIFWVLLKILSCLYIYFLFK